MSFVFRLLYVCFFICFRIFICASAFCLHVCLYTVYVPGALSGQKMAPDHLQLGLQMGVSHYVGAGNQTSILLKDASVLNC